VRCYGCKAKLTEGAWYFIDAPPGRKLGLCDPCHRDSVPSKHRREWTTFAKPKLFSGGELPHGTGLMNSKSGGQQGQHGEF
jgi:hypothetical protein